MAANNSYVYRLLARLAFLSTNAVPPNESQSAEELYSWLLRASKEVDVSGERFSPPASVEAILEVLQKLEDLGIVQSVPNTNTDNDDPTQGTATPIVWRFSPLLLPSEKLAIADGGNSFDRTPPGIPPGGGEGDNQGGQGLGEVLAHPILFALPEDEWEAAIGSALSNQ